MVLRLLFAALLIPGLVGSGASQTPQGPVQTQPRPGFPSGPVRDRAPVAAGTARISGRVVAAETGNPLRRAVVRLSGEGLRDGRAVGTDVEGRFEIRDLPSGRFTMNAQKGGYVTLEYGQRRPFERGTQIELTDGQVLTGVTFALPRGSVITGRIVDEFGEPFAEAMVQVLRYRYVDGRRRLVPVGPGDRTNDIGEYRIFGLSPGEYLVSARVRNGREFDGGAGGQSTSASGYAPTYYPGTPSAAEAQRVSVNLGTEQGGIDFAVMPARLARISGTAVGAGGQPITNASINMVDASPDSVGGFGGNFGTRLRPDGTFTITGVPPGDYVLQLRTGGGRDARRDPEFASQRITVSGADVSGITLAASRGATATGRIVTEDGAAPSFAPRQTRVVAIPSEPGPLFAFNAGDASVQEDWTFELRGLAGSQTLRLSGLPPGWFRKAVYLNGTEVTDSPATFSGSGTVAGLQIVITDRTTELNGSVTDSGKPVTSFTVVVFAEDAQRWGFQSRFVSTGRSDQEGRFRIRSLPPEKYLAVALDSLPEGDASDPEFLERLRPFGTSVTLGEGETKAIALKLTR